MLISNSEGTVEMGQGREGDASVGGSAGGMETEEKEAMSSDIVEAGGPSREWWAGLGTVTAALDGFGFEGFDFKEDGGKCLFL